MLDDLELKTACSVIAFCRVASSRVFVSLQSTMCVVWFSRNVANSGVRLKQLMPVWPWARQRSPMYSMHWGCAGAKDTLLTFVLATANWEKNYLKWKQALCLIHTCLASIVTWQSLALLRI